MLQVLTVCHASLTSERAVDARKGTRGTTVACLVFQNVISPTTHATALRQSTHGMRVPTLGALRANAGCRPLRSAVLGALCCWNTDVPRHGCRPRSQGDCTPQHQPSRRSGDVSPSSVAIVTRLRMEQPETPDHSTHRLSLRNSVLFIVPESSSLTGAKRQEGRSTPPLLNTGTHSSDQRLESD